jgi:hypothetical protein
MLASKESFMNTKWRWMWTLQNNMSSCVYKRFFTLSESSPEKENDSIFLIRQLLDHRISKSLPSNIFVRSRSIFLDRQNGIQKEYSLLSSFRQISTLGWQDSQIILKLLENIF